MIIKTIDCLEFRQWRDKDAQNDALNGHKPHVFRKGWRRKVYRCRGSQRPWAIADLETRLLRYLSNRDMSIKELIRA